MARKKSEIAQAIEQTTKADVADKKVIAEADDVPENVLNLMCLYPQYERVYVSTKGFVYTENTPEAMRGDAILYVNKFYKQ